MSKPKKLDLSIDKLAIIASALNENILANKNRSKEEKISTDTLIKDFGINRKDFSETIKDTEIKFNKSTFLYDIPSTLLSNNKVTLIDKKAAIAIKQQSNNKVTPKKNHSQFIMENLPSEFRKIVSLSEEIEEMLTWYQLHKDDSKIIDIPEININRPELEGETTTRSFKTYVKVLDTFAEYCKGKKETQKDLLALALVEFMDKYK